jgi:hypothetical protein
MPAGVARIIGSGGILALLAFVIKLLKIKIVTRHFLFYN